MKTSRLLEGFRAEDALAYLATCYISGRIKGVEGAGTESSQRRDRPTKSLRGLQRRAFRESNVAAILPEALRYPESCSLQQTGWNDILPYQAYIVPNFKRSGD
ncbi:hypothetical protein HZ326_8949 [Fusarium oxysporum f. sp. albedinis]|nr:hypothetical protein HZ326_8949 [Fusarium oxysporum f. sp. albedinis]